MAILSHPPLEAAGQRVVSPRKGDNVGRLLPAPPLLIPADVIYTTLGDGLAGSETRPGGGPAGVVLPRSPPD